MFSTVSSIVSNIKTKIHSKLSSIKAVVATKSQPIEHISTHNAIETSLTQTKTKPTEDKIKPLKFHKLVKIKVDVCPHCKYIINERTMHKYVMVEGPMFLKKELSKEHLRPLIRISEVLKCSRCGYEKTKKKIYIPLETVDLLEPLLCGDIVEVIDKVKDISSNIEKILTDFLG